MTCWCGTYCCDGTSDSLRLLLVTSSASELPMPAAEEPGRSRRSFALTNPGELSRGDTRRDVPVTDAEEPLVQPGDTQLASNARFV
jgi:hypothetical protein